MSTWNKFCFTGGAIVTSIRLPGRSDICAFGVFPRLALGKH